MYIFLKISSTKITQKKTPLARAQTRLQISKDGETKRWTRLQEVRHARSGRDNTLVIGNGVENFEIAVKLLIERQN